MTWRPAWTKAATIGLAAVLIGVLQLAAVFNPSVVELDPEERYNAGPAVAFLNGHADALFALQYRDFCGGCTADALLGAGFFSVFGESWLVWKLVPLSFTLLLAIVGMWALWRKVGPVAALALGALLLFPPRAWLYLSMVAWGNHMEAGVLSLVGLLVLATARGHVGTAMGGLLQGLALWVGFSGGPGLLAGGLCLLFARRVRHMPTFILAAAVGVGPWLLQFWLAGTHPFVQIYGPGDLAAIDGGPLYKLGTLLKPRQLVALFGLPHTQLGFGLGLAWAGAFGAAVVECARHRGPIARAVLLALGCWLVVYLGVRFQVYDPPAPEIAVPGSVRYAAPLYPVAFVLLALAAQSLWRRRGPVWASALLFGPLLAGVATRFEALTTPFPAFSARNIEPVDWDWFRNQASYLIELEAHQTRPQAHPRMAALSAYALGRADAGAKLRPDAPVRLADLRPRGQDADAWAEGVCEAVLDFHDPDRDGDLTALAATWDALATAPVSPPAGWPAALSQSLWPRRFGDVDWQRAAQQMDAAGLAQAQGLLASLPEGARAAAMTHLGRVAGDAQAGAFVPRSLTLPVSPAQAGPHWLRGYGQALGASWGPGDHPLPAGLTGADAATHQGALRSGMLQGAARAWTGVR